MPGKSGQGDGLSSPGSAPSVVRSLFEHINAGRWNDAAELLSPNAVDHSAPPEQAAGRDGWTARWKGVAAMLPDMHTDIQEMVETNGLVATRSRVTATPAEGFMGRPPGERSIDVLAFDMMRVRDGLIVEHWGLGDLAAIIRQLDLKIVPAN